MIRTLTAAILLAMSGAASAQNQTECVFSHQVGMVRSLTPAQADYEMAHASNPLRVDCGLDDQAAFFYWRDHRFDGIPIFDDFKKQWGKYGGIPAWAR